MGLRVRHLPVFVKLASVAFVVAIVAALAAVALGVTARFTNWVAADGKHINIVWISDGLPPLPAAELAVARKHRTRDGSHLRHQNGCNCALVFWKTPADASADTRFADLMAGFNGCTDVTIDCCVSDAAGETWLLGSGKDENERGEMIDGPQYRAIGCLRGRMHARAPIGGLIDCERLYQDLVQRIENPDVRQKMATDWIDFALGRMDPDVVTCSGLIGQCILRQPSSPLAAALRKAMKERVTYGEITPNDLARTVAIAETGRPDAQFTQTPVLRAFWNAVR
ncbi:MAG: hypothetical protein ABSB67_13085 [Bryobacteraceae bacterium]